MADIIEITDFSAPELDIFSRLTESQLLHYYEPNGGIFIAESPKVIGRALDSGCSPLSLLLDKRELHGEVAEIIERCGDIPVYVSDPEVLVQLTGFHLTRGALCAMKRPALPSIEEICCGASRIAILENVMNPTNVGAIFRSAAALGMDAVLLTNGCSDPFYRRCARVSMGTVFQIPWTYIGSDWPHAPLSLLREMGFKTAAMALCDNSVSIDDPKLMSEEKLALILGTEGDGLAASTIAKCDYTVKIPMFHGVDSLNVAAASAVAFWQLSAHKLHLPWLIHSYFGGSRKQHLTANDISSTILNGCKINTAKDGRQVYCIVANKYGNSVESKYRCVLHELSLKNAQQKSID